LFLLTAGLGFSQDISSYIQNAKMQVQTGYYNWDEKQMLAGRAAFERLLGKSERDWLIRYYIAYCDYRLTTYAVNQKDTPKIKKYLRDGFEQLEQCLALNPQCADAWALMSAMYGYKIAVSPWSGFWYGPKSGTAIATAKKLEPNNPRIALIEGISAFHTPEKWGGGRERARSLFMKAIELFKTEHPASGLPDWGYSEAYAWFGILCQKENDPATANMHFLKALEIDPENGWVRYNLLPKVNQTKE
jgi:tetratricopeptide (TPR) repeat protein